MKIAGLILLIFLLIESRLAPAQDLTTKEARVVLVMEKKTNKVKHLEMLSQFKKKSDRQISEGYADSRFYLGLLKGTYRMEGNKVVPGNESTIRVYTNKQLYPGDQIFAGRDLAIGEHFEIGETKATVISSKEGELIIEMIEKK